MSQRFTIEDLQRKGYQVSGDKAAKPNKIRGAEKQEVNGIKFASKLELYMYNLLKATKIPFQFQETFYVQPAFEYMGKKIQPIKIIVDFHLPQFHMIIDTKGHQLADNKLKFKMLKYSLYNEMREHRIELPATKEECEKLVNELLKVQS